jgi:hypothetical protein
VIIKKKKKKIRDKIDVLGRIGDVSGRIRDISRFIQDVSESIGTYWSVSETESACQSE